MSVTADVPTGPEREALVVPKDAVLVRPDGATLWVALHAVNGGSDVVYPLPVMVTVRLKDEYAVVPETDQGREFLRDGAIVVIEGAERLVRGQEVTWNEATPAAATGVEESPPAAAPQRADAAASRRQES